jgi:HEPN domain-containing protein
MRLHQLSQPTPQLLLSTWKQHAHHLAPSYIDNFRKTLSASNFIETEQAVGLIAQMKLDEIQRRRYRRHEIRRLRRKIAKKQEAELRKVMRKIYGMAKDVFMNGQEYQLVGEAARIAGNVKKDLSKFMGESF